MMRYGLLTLFAFLLAACSSNLATPMDVPATKVMVEETKDSTAT
jgi:PBP1b-binding outer membrane lipoprotein LpoB